MSGVRGQQVPQSNDMTAVFCVSGKDFAVIEGAIPRILCTRSYMLGSWYVNKLEVVPPF